MPANPEGEKTDVFAGNTARGSMRRRLAFIVNPTACSGKCKDMFARAKPRFDADGAQYEVFVTEYPRHAELLTAQALEKGFDTIVAVGGDGTVHEVATALVGKKATLGILPFGTGNDFAAALKIPKAGMLASELILTGTAKPTDVGRANGQLFINVCGFGFDADVLVRVARRKWAKRGMLPYLFGVADVLLHNRKIHASISLDGGEEQEMDVQLIAVCNGISFGGGMLVAPEASPQDGFFDICIAKYFGKFRIMALLPKFIKGKHLNSKQIVYTRASRISVRADDVNIVELDGELIEKTPIECEIIGGALNVLRP